MEAGSGGVMAKELNCHIIIIFTNPSAQAGYDTRAVF